MPLLQKKLNIRYFIFFVADSHYLFCAFLYFPLEKTHELCDLCTFYAVILRLHYTFLANCIVGGIAATWLLVGPQTLVLFNLSALVR